MFSWLTQLFAEVVYNLLNHLEGMSTNQEEQGIGLRAGENAGS